MNRQELFRVRGHAHKALNRFNLDTRTLPGDYMTDTAIDEGVYRSCAGVCGPTIEEVVRLRHLSALRSTLSGVWDEHLMENFALWPEIETLVGNGVAFADSSIDSYEPDATLTGASRTLRKQHAKVVEKLVRTARDMEVTIAELTDCETTT